MTERVLYGNVNEPEFPFEKVKGKLDWLKELLSRANDGWDEWVLFPDRLNIVLVFAHARTSTLVGHMSEYETLVQRLNTVLESAGAKRHRLFVAERGTQNFKVYFVTCKRNPRFIWRMRPSTFDIGKNLDYFAAGHCCRDWNDEIGAMKVIETETKATVSDEVVQLKYLDEESTLQLHQFYDAKVGLMSDSCRQLGLPYRFIWVFVTRAKRESIRQTLRDLSPPDEDWWQDNIHWVNQVIPISNDHCLYPQTNFLPTCDYRSRWPIITMLYWLSDKMKSKPISYDSATTTAVWTLFGQVEDIVNDSEFEGNANEYAENLKARFDAFIPSPSAAEPFPTPEKPQAVARGFMTEFKAWTQEWGRIFQEGCLRHIMPRKPVPNVGLQTPESSFKYFINDIATRNL